MFLFNIVLDGIIQVEAYKPMEALNKSVSEMKGKASGAQKPQHIGDM